MMNKSTIIAAWVVCLVMLIASLFLCSYYEHIRHWSADAWRVMCLMLSMIQFVLTGWVTNEITKPNKE